MFYSYSVDVGESPGHWVCGSRPTRVQTEVNWPGRCTLAGMHEADSQCIIIPVGVTMEYTGVHVRFEEASCFQIHFTNRNRVESRECWNNPTLSITLQSCS